MMGVDDFQVVRQTLDNLEYYDELDLISLPLIKNILKDLQDLSKHCAEIELENEELKKKQVNNFDEVMETSKNADPLNDTYLLEVVDSAKSQIEKLQVELNNVKHENEKLKESTVSSPLLFYY
jgi:predicted RNase H-like nuclease (RuvC/YqgF family)